MNLEVLLGKTDFLSRQKNPRLTQNRYNLSTSVTSLILSTNIIFKLNHSEINILIMQNENKLGKSFFFKKKSKNTLEVFDSESKSGILPICKKSLFLTLKSLKDQNKYT